MVTTADDEPTVEVVVVDDSPDVRLLLSLTFGTDDRFALVGEAADGRAAIELARQLHPDLMIIDRQMPGMGGLEAIPDIHRESPETAIVLYTAGADPGMSEAAIAAGAADVLGKEVVSIDLVDTVARILVNHWAEDAGTVEVNVGPVPSAAARVWVENTECIIRAVRERPDVVDVPSDVLDTFERFLATWRDMAAGTEEFRWVGRAPVEDVVRLVTSWADIDALTDEQLDTLHCHWSPPDGAPFFRALTGGVLEALAKHEKTQRLAAMLAGRWVAPSG